MDDRATKGLHENKSIQGYANAMVRVGQRPLEAHGLEGADNGSSREEYRRDLQPDVELECGARVWVVETGHEYGSRDYE